MSSPPLLPLKREEVASWRTSRDTLMHIVADGEWSRKDMENLRDYIDLSLKLGCFDPAPKPDPTP